MKNDLVKKSNSLNEAHYYLTVAEYRILHMAFSSLAECDVDPDFFRNVRFTVKAKDYMKLYGVDRTTAYQALREASERLFNRYFTYDELVNKDLMLYERIKSRWVTKIGYQDNQAYISFFLSDDVLSMVGNLKEQYTYLNLHKCANLTSIYAIRMYEMLMQWRKTKAVPVISLEELKMRFRVANDEYTRMYDFKNRVLDMAIRQINEFTDIIIKYEQIKEGRKITGFKFDFKYKAKPKLEKPKNTVKSPQSPDLFEGLSKEECTVITRQVNDYIKYLELKGEKVNQFYHENIINKAVSEQWGIAEFEEQKQQRQARKAEQERIAQEEKIQKDAENERYKQLSIYFENLPAEQQKELIAKAEKQVIPILKDSFNQSVERGDVHTNSKFRHFIYQAMQDDA